jgi:hypothetical protein
MVIRTVAVVAVLAGVAVPQEQKTKVEFGRIEELDRLKTLKFTVGLGESAEEYVVTWYSPATPGEDSVFRVQKSQGGVTTKMESFSFTGIENGALKLIRSPGRNTDRVRLSIPREDGAFHYYPPSTIDLELGFRIVPDKPKRGLYKVEPIFP